MEHGHFHRRGAWVIGLAALPLIGCATGGLALAPGRHNGRGAGGVEAGVDVGAGRNRGGLYVEAEFHRPPDASGQEPGGRVSADGRYRRLFPATRDGATPFLALGAGAGTLWGASEDGLLLIGLAEIGVEVWPSNALRGVGVAAALRYRPQVVLDGDEPLRSYNLFQVALSVRFGAAP